jgi:cullin 1
LQGCESLFHKFYQAQHSGRKLNWLHQLSKGELKTRYLPSNKAGYTFQTSTYQMGILLSFNNEENMTAEDIQIATQLTDAALKTTLLVSVDVFSSYFLDTYISLQSLAKAKVLNMEPDEEEIQKTHKFSLNKQFKR